jgi:hypothetical protein
LSEGILPPFSARNRGAQAQIDNAFPESAKIGLLHLLEKLAKVKYIDWQAMTAELKRIARVLPSDEPDLEHLVISLPWQTAFDFCERIHNHLAQEVTGYDDPDDGLLIITSRSEVQEYISNELQQLFLEEHLAFEFSDGLVRRRGRRHTEKQVSGAELVLGDPRLNAARKQFTKALDFFRDVSKPDYENAVKEAVCAVEAAARALFPSSGTTLGDIVKSITGSEQGKIPNAVAKTFHGLYGFRGSGEGVAHGGTDGGVVTKELAEYVLAVCASQIIFLRDLADTQEPEVPF